MKLLLLLASTFALLALPLCAQTAGTPTSSAPSSGPSGAASMQSPMLATLTPEEKTKLMAVHGQVVDQNPDLKKEEMDLMQKGMAMQSGEMSDVDRQAFITQVRAHADKVRTAMIKADPSIQAIFAKITAQGEKLKAQSQSGQH